MSVERAFGSGSNFSQRLDVERDSKQRGSNERDSADVATVEVVQEEQKEWSSSVRSSTDSSYKSANSCVSHSTKNRNASKTDDKLMDPLDVLNSALGLPDDSQKHLLNLNMLYSFLLALLKKSGMEKSKIPIGVAEVPTGGAMVQDPQPEALTDLWTMIQLQKATEANRDGVAKLSEIIQSIIEKLANVDGIGASILNLTNELGNLRRLSADAQSAASDAIAKSDEVQKELQAQRKSMASTRSAAEEAGGDDGTVPAGNTELEKRLKDMEEQMEKLNKFRKAATFKIQGLPEGAGAAITSATNLLTGGNTPENFKALLDVLETMSDMQVKEMKNIGDLLNRTFDGQELSQLKLLMQMVIGNDQNLEERLKKLEDILLGAKGELEGEDEDSEKRQGPYAASMKARAALFAKKRNRDLLKECEEMREDLKMIRGMIGTLVDDGGLDAANQTYEEMKRLKDLISAMKFDQDKLFMMLGRVENDVREMERLLKSLDKQTREMGDFKADRKWVIGEIDKKADIGELVLKLDKERYEMDLDELDDSFAEYSEQAMAKFMKMKEALEQLRQALERKLDKTVHEVELRQLRTRMNFIENVLKWIEEVFNGDHDSAGFRNKIIRYNCTGCDRTVHMATLQRKKVASGNRSGNAVPTLAPMTAYEVAEIRRNRNAGDFSSGNGPSYIRTLQRRNQMREERRIRGVTANEPVGQVRVTDLHDFRNEAFGRATGFGDVLDTYAQDPRPVGSGFKACRTVPCSRPGFNYNNDEFGPVISGSGIEVIEDPVNPAEDVNRKPKNRVVFEVTGDRGGSEAVAAIPTSLLTNEVDLMSRMGGNVRYRGINGDGSIYIANADNDPPPPSPNL